MNTKLNIIKNVNTKAMETTLFKNSKQNLFLYKL